MRRNTPRSGRHDAGGVELCCQIPRLCVPLDPAPGRCARLQHADGARTDDPHQRQRLCHHGDVQKGGESKKKIKHNTKKKKNKNTRANCVSTLCCAHAQTDRGTARRRATTTVGRWTRAEVSDPEREWLAGSLNWQPHNLRCVTPETNNA